MIVFHPLIHGFDKRIESSLTIFSLSLSLSLLFLNISIRFSFIIQFFESNLRYFIAIHGNLKTRYLHRSLITIYYLLITEV